MSINGCFHFFQGVELSCNSTQAKGLHNHGNVTSHAHDVVPSPRASPKAELGSGQRKAKQAVASVKHWFTMERLLTFPTMLVLPTA